MTQAFPPFQQFVSRIQDSVITVLHSKSFRQLRHQVEEVKGVLLGLIGLVILLLWNWQLFLSLAIGALALIWVYLAHQGEFKIAWFDWRKLWSRSNRSLTLAVVSGGIAASSTYLLMAVWQEVGSSWLTIGMILQGLGILTLLLLLVWQAIAPYFARQNDHIQKFDKLLADLSDLDPLKRLIAVRQITHWISSASPSSQSSSALTGSSLTDLSLVGSFPMASSHLIECFRLMLNRETEPLVCSALLESLQILSPAPQLRTSSLPWSIHAGTKQTRVKARRQFPTQSQGQ